MKKLALCAMILAGASSAANAQTEAGILAGIGTTGAFAAVSFLGFLVLAVSGTTTATTTTAP
jgi:hypothetical protein